MHYVKIINGVLTAGPFELSHDPSFSPNKDWSAEQLARHDFYLTDASVRSDETLNLASFTVTGQSVSFQKPKKSQATLDAEALEKANQEKLRLKETFDGLSKEKKKSFFDEIKNDDDVKGPV